MLSQAVRDELKSELEHLRVERQRAISRYDAKIAAIEAILGDVSPAQAPLPLENARQTGSNGHDASQSFRGTILSVVRGYPSGLRSGEIADKLEAIGFKPGGDSSLKSRVYGEVNRLYKAKRLDRRKGKYFQAAEKTEKPM